MWSPTSIVRVARMTGQSPVYSAPFRALGTVRLSEGQRAGVGRSRFSGRARGAPSTAVGGHW